MFKSFKWIDYANAALLTSVTIGSIIQHLWILAAWQGIALMWFINWAYTRWLKNKYNELLDESMNLNKKMLEAFPKHE